MEPLNTSLGSLRGTSLGGSSSLVAGTGLCLRSKAFEKVGSLMGIRC